MGLEEWADWQKFSKKEGCLDPVMLVDTPPVMEHGGLAFGPYIWIRSKKDKNTVFHEVQHSLDALFEVLGADEESEFKAYIAGHVNEKVFEWLIE